jgi:hypothetical protein
LRTLFPLKSKELRSSLLRCSVTPPLTVPLTASLTTASLTVLVSAVVSLHFPSRQISQQNEGEFDYFLAYHDLNALLVRVQAVDKNRSNYLKIFRVPRFAPLDITTAWVNQSWCTQILVDSTTSWPTPRLRLSWWQWLQWFSSESVAEKEEGSPILWSERSEQFLVSLKCRPDGYSWAQIFFIPTNRQP